MDLISIRRKYRNIRWTIIVTFFIVLCLALALIFNEKNKNKIYEDIYISYINQYKQATLVGERLLEEQRKAEAEAKKARCPQVTENGRTNMENIYKSEQKRVFLTFDDGPSQTVTIPILDTLKQENVRATFFVLGSRVELYPEIVKREFEENHFIASHGYSHVYSQIYASPQCVIDENNKTVLAIQNAIGQPDYNPHLFRFPGGLAGGKYAKIKKEAAEILKQNDIFHIDWNALTSDSAGKHSGEEFIAELEKTVPKHNSVVVLMHDAAAKKSTAESLPQIIAYFRERGYEFTNFYDIFKQ